MTTGNHPDSFAALTELQVGERSWRLFQLEALERRGLSASVISFPGLRPLDEAAILAAARGHRAVLTIEEHSVNGGFGSRVADVLMQAGLAPRFAKFGITDELRGQTGSQDWLLDRLGSIEERAAALL